MRGQEGAFLVELSARTIRASVGITFTLTESNHYPNICSACKKTEVQRSKVTCPQLKKKKEIWDKAKITVTMSQFLLEFDRRILNFTIRKKILLISPLKRKYSVVNTYAI